MAFDLTTAIVSHLAGRVFASSDTSLGSIASCAGGTVAVLARLCALAVIGRCPETRGQVGRAKAEPRRSEGSLPAGADHRATTLYSVGPQGPDHDAVMRIGGEAPGRRAQSRKRCQHHAMLWVTATSDRQRRP